MSDGTQDEEQRAHSDAKPSLPLIRDIRPMSARQIQTEKWDMFYDVYQDRLIRREDSQPAFKLGEDHFGTVEEILKIPADNRDAHKFHEYCFGSRGPRVFFDAIPSWGEEACPIARNPQYETLIPETEGFLCWVNNSAMNHPQRELVFVRKANVDTPGNVNNSVDPWVQSWTNIAPTAHYRVPQTTCEEYESMFDAFAGREEKGADEEVVLLSEENNLFSSRRLELDDQDFDVFLHALTTKYWRRCISFVMQKYPIPRAYLVYGGFRFRIKTKAEIAGVFELFLDYRNDHKEWLDEENTDWCSTSSSNPIHDELFDECKTKLNVNGWFS